ncbi:MAG: response regulator [Marinosulfonomonas sp.]|nr:MAG: response regulator [Marinosulfonomonas sp.]
MDDFNDMIMGRTPTAARPLLGLTVLVVEDSRFASEAMRLLCLRSGARIRRADCLGAARKHLRVYRPSVVVVDLGLPDGSGTDLIAELAQSSPRIEVILGISGDAGGEADAMAAGADGFFAKPIDSLGVFQQAILAHLPDTAQPPGPRMVSNETITPDPIAFRDDIAHVADVLRARPDGKMLDYVAQFTTGVARSAHDGPLEAAALALANDRANGQPIRSDVQRLNGMFKERLAGGEVV